MRNLRTSIVLATLAIALMASVTACGGDEWITIDSREHVVQTGGDSVIFDTGPVDSCDLTLERDLRDDLQPTTHRLDPYSSTSYNGAISTESTFDNCIGVRYRLESQ